MLTPPTFIKPRLAQLVKAAPAGRRLASRKARRLPDALPLDGGRVKILTRRANNWTAKYPTIAEAVAALPVQNGELCDLRPDDRTAFNLIQNPTETGEGLVYFEFDLLFLDGEDLRSRLPRSVAIAVGVRLIRRSTFTLR
jgi:bifunctional non-homologous end joining protein LigD